MSDTPRTDTEEAMYSLSSVNSWGMGGWDFARTIERELAAVTRERDEARAMHAEAFRCGIEHQEDARALRAEVKRLRGALSSIAEQDYERAAVNFCAATCVQIARAALQEPTP